MVFYELPAVAKFREGYLDDDAYKELQGARLEQQIKAGTLK